jgi:hypothetical protein
MIHQDLNDRLSGGTITVSDDPPIGVSYTITKSSGITGRGSLRHFLEEGRIQVADAGREAILLDLPAHSGCLVIVAALVVMSRRQEASEVSLGRLFQVRDGGFQHFGGLVEEVAGAL